MKPQIDSTKFGTITIEGQTYDHDVFITLEGEVCQREKRLSKAVFGTSHTLSREEAEHIYEKGAERLIFGTGQMGRAHLSDEAAAFFAEHGMEIILQPTPRALKTWNAAEGQTLGLFHLTC